MSPRLLQCRVCYKYDKRMIRYYYSSSTTGAVLIFVAVVNSRNPLTNAVLIVQVQCHTSTLYMFRLKGRCA